MSDEVLVSLMEAQLKKASNIVRDMARMTGVGYAIWPTARAIMEQFHVDRVDLAEYLASCEVKESWSMLGGISRYLVESNDPDEQIASVTVSVHQDVMTIEVVTLKIKEVRK